MSKSNNFEGDELRRLAKAYEVIGNFNRFTEECSNYCNSLLDAETEYEGLFPREVIDQSIDVIMELDILNKCLISSYERLADIVEESERRKYES